VFLALFVPILLVEAAVLKSFMQADPYLRHLRRVFYPNLISSAVGSVLYGMVIGPFYFARNWDLDLGLPSFSLDNLFTWGFYLIVAVAVEFPVVYYLYSKNVSLTRALLMTCAMNTVSYSLLMIVYGVFT